MRQVVLDTETTGLEIADGNRIIEIGCVEIVNRKITTDPDKGQFHHYINPERDSEEGALRVHGITTEFLSDKPLFADIVEPFLDFVRGAELIIHNAAFDIRFINHELSLLGREPIESHIAGIVDTLDMAKQQYPGKRNSLDALCDRLEVSRTARTLHGALLDAELLAEVYLRLTRGQDSLIPLLDADAGAAASPSLSMDGVGSAHAGGHPIAQLALHLPVIHASPAERQAHEAMLAVLDKASGGKTIWRQLAEQAGQTGQPGQAATEP